MIAIIDCNSFYASCERLFRPDLRKKPIVVLSNNDGCIIARSDEAKELGVKMGAVFHQVKRELDKLGVYYFSSNYQLYGDMSDRVMRCLQAINSNIEVYSIDEAFLDLSALKIDDYAKYALGVRNKVFSQTGIPISVGIAPTKVLAKVANRLAKRDKEKTGGVMALVNQEEIEEALRKTPVGDVWGFGYRKAKKLRLDFGWVTAYDCYKNMTPEIMRKQFAGVVGLRVLRELRGEQSIQVAFGAENKKHIASTRSFGKPIKNLSELKEAISTYTERAIQKMEHQHSACRTVGVYIRTDPFKREDGYYSKSAYGTLKHSTTNPQEIIEKACALVEQIFSPKYTYVKAGIFLSGFESADPNQLTLFVEQEKQQENHAAGEKIAALLSNSEKLFGKKQITTASSGIQPEWQMRMKHSSPGYTTKWSDLPVVGMK